MESNPKTEGLKTPGGREMPRQGREPLGLAPWREGSGGFAWRVERTVDSHAKLDSFRLPSFTGMVGFF